MPEIINPKITSEAHSAIEAFHKAEKELEDFEEYLSTGAFLTDIFAQNVGDLKAAQLQFQRVWDRGRNLIEDCNAKLRTAKDSLRSLVQLAPSQWRGPDGKPTTVAEADFNATSVTKRSFDWQSLSQLVGKHGLLDRLFELTTVDKDGKAVKVVQQKFIIEYEPMLHWLRANNLKDVEDGAYNEVESTPQCRGPKERYFFGDKKKDH